MNRLLMRLFDIYGLQYVIIQGIVAAIVARGSYYDTFQLLMDTMSLSENTWFIYMVYCADSTLYTGITTDLEKRIKQHNSSRGGAKYTRGRKPVSLVYFEEVANRSLAAKREHDLKKLSSKEKQLLINSFSSQ